MKEMRRGVLGALKSEGRAFHDGIGGIEDCAARGKLSSMGGRAAGSGLRCFIGGVGSAVG